MRIALLHLRTERPWDTDFQQDLDELNAGAVAAVEELGWTATLVPCAQLPEHVVRRTAAGCDAVVILGGEDVDPPFYGAPERYQDAGWHEPLADAAQIDVVRDALVSGRPLLGICRGHQLLNVALGGTLIQHLATVDQHRGPGKGRDGYVTSDVALVPPIDELDRTSTTRRLLAEDLGLPTTPGAVPHSRPLCSHHQAIHKLGAGLSVAARASDGVIEAVVHESAPITGVQWHPEHPEVSRVQLTRLLRRLERQSLAGARAPV